MKYAVITRSKNGQKEISQKIMLSDIERIYPVIASDFPAIAVVHNSTDDSIDNTWTEYFYDSEDVSYSIEFE